MKGGMGHMPQELAEGAPEGGEVIFCDAKYTKIL